MEDTAANTKPLSPETENTSPTVDFDWLKTIDKEIQAQLSQIDRLPQDPTTSSKVIPENPAPEQDSPALVKANGLTAHLPETLSPTEVAKPVITEKPLQTPFENTASNEEENLDPLSASVVNALRNLTEGNKVNQEWTLAKIFKTSFGGNNSSFYELVNSAGANWTLNLEEMKDLLRKEITDKKTEIGRANLPGISPVIPVKKAVPVEKKEEIITKPVKIDNEAKEQKEPASQAEKPTKFNLNTEQVALLKKIHENSQDWKAFTSISTDQWDEINGLYQKGQLVEFGIDANPIFDFLNNPDVGSLIEVNPDDTFVSILQSSGHKTTQTNQDGPLFAIHVIANRLLLEDLRTKGATAGLAIKPLPSDKELIELAKESLAGKLESFQDLVAAVQIIPLHERIRILKPVEVENLIKFLKT